MCGQGREHRNRGAGGEQCLGHRWGQSCGQLVPEIRGHYPRRRRGRGRATFDHPCSTSSTCIPPPPRPHCPRVAYTRRSAITIEGARWDMVLDFPRVLYIPRYRYSTYPISGGVCTTFFTLSGTNRLLRYRGIYQYPQVAFVLLSLPSPYPIYPTTQNDTYGSDACARDNTSCGCLPC